MSTRDDAQTYRIAELERKVVGLQRQVGVIHACADASNRKTERRLRDLEIRTAVQRGAPQKELGQLYNLSAGRISQIVKKIA